MKSLKQIFKSLTEKVDVLKGADITTDTPSAAPNLTPTARSLDLFVEIMSSYPIASNIASRLKKTDLMTLPLCMPKIGSVFFSQVPASSMESIDSLLYRSGAMRTHRQEGFRALTEGVTQYVLLCRSKHIEKGEFDYSDVFGYSSNYKRVKGMQRGKDYFGSDGGDVVNHCSFDEFIPTKPHWGQSSRGYNFNKKVDQGAIQDARETEAYPRCDERFDEILLRSQSLERSLLLSRLRTFRDEIHGCRSDATAAESDVCFHGLMLHLYPYRRRPEPPCRCDATRCMCPGLSFKKELEGAFGGQFFEVMYNQEYVVPLPVTKDQLDQVVESLEGLKWNEAWTPHDKQTVRSILAFRSAIRKAPLPTARTDQYYKILLRRCMECSICGRNSEQLAQNSALYNRKGDRSCQSRNGTGACWGCKEMICYECTIHTYLRLPMCPASHYFFMPIIYRHYFHLGLRTPRFFLPCLRFYATHAVSSRGWGAHVLSCPPCFKKLPRNGYPDTIPKTESKVVLRIRYNGDPAEYSENLDLRDVTVLWAWCHPIAGRLQGIDRRHDWRVPGTPGVGMKARVMGEKLGWTYRLPDHEMGSKCVWFTPDYKYTYF